MTADDLREENVRTKNNFIATRQFTGRTHDGRVTARLLYLLLFRRYIFTLKTIVQTTVFRSVPSDIMKDLFEYIRCN